MRPTKALCLILGGVVAGALPSWALAQGSSVVQLFEQHGLIGVFAVDCRKAAAGDNQYYVQRVLGAAQVQHDQMSGRAARDFALVIDQAQLTSPNELAYSGTIDTQRFTSVVRVERRRMRMIEMTRVTTASGRPLSPGEKIIAGGRFNHGVETPWLNKCD